MVRSHSLTSADNIRVHQTFGMTGLIPNCDKDDFDQDGDGFVSDEYEGIETLGVLEQVYLVAVIVKTPTQTQPVWKRL